MRVRLRCLALLLIAVGAGEARPADAVPSTPAAAPVKPLSEVLRDFDAMLLAGEPLPPDFLLELAPLPPAERLLAVAYARRAGLLTGPALPLADLLAEDRP